MDRRQAFSAPPRSRAVNEKSTTMMYGAALVQPPPPLGTSQSPSSRAPSDPEPQQVAMLIQQLDKIMVVEPGNEAYLEALRINPSVVRTEADPVQFLRRDDFDVSRAAQRLCRYWTLRKKAFGERFARPVLDLSGNGALTPENVEFVKTAVTALLPNDEQGHSVLLNDHDRLEMTNLEADQHRLQNSFYLNCLLSMNPTTQTEGFVILRAALDPFDSKFSVKRFTQTVVNIVNIMPVKLHAFHLCCLPKEKAAKRHFIKTVLPHFVQALGPDVSKKAVIHLESSPEKMAEKLQAHGILKSAIPPKLGGTWSYDDYATRMFGADHDAKLPTAAAAAASGFAKSQLNVLAQAVESQIQKEAMPAPFAAAPACPTPFKNVLDKEISLIPNSKKQAYLEAVQQGVLEDPLPFVKVCGGDTKKAALRLVDYWKLRKEIFQERAFRPILDLSGNGALTAHEVDALEDGRPCAQLPDTAGGSALVYVDHSCKPSSESIDMESRLRCVVYLLTRVASNPQVSGVTMLRLVRQADFDRLSLQYLATLAGAMPLEIHNFHFCCLPPKGGSRSNFLGTFVPVYEQLLTVTFGQKAVVHVAEKKTKMLGELLSCGFSKNGLPITLGGTWSFDNVISWLHQKQPANSPPENDGNPTSSSRGDGLKSLADAAHQARIEDRKARKRMMDAIYARKRRQREKGEQQQLQQKCVELTKANMDLEQENLRFERMLADAKSKISLIEYGMQIAEKKQSKKRKKKIALSAARAEQQPRVSVKKPKLDTANLKAGGVVNRSNVESGAPMQINEKKPPNGPNPLLHRRQVSMPLDSDKPPASNDATTQILELLTKLQKDQQQAELTKQRDELLMQLLSAKRAQDQQRSNDQQSLLQQLAEALSGRSPQQASTAVSFNEKNALHQVQLPQGLLSASSQQQQQQPQQQQVAPVLPNAIQQQLQEFVRQQQQSQQSVQPSSPPHQQVQPAASSIQGLLNQLLVANASQSNGLSGLQGFATTVTNPLAPPAANNPQANIGQQQQSKHLLNQIMGASSTAYASNPASGQLQDFLSKQFSM